MFSRSTTARATVRGRPLWPRAQHFDYWGKDVRSAIGSAPFLAARGFTLNADLVLDRRMLRARWLPGAAGSAAGACISIRASPLSPGRNRPIPRNGESRLPRRLPQGATKLTLRFAREGRGKARGVLSAAASLRRGTTPKRS